MIQDQKIKLERSQEQLFSYAGATGLVMTAEKNADDTKLTDVQKQLSDAVADRLVKQSKFETAAAGPPEAMPEVLDDAALQATQRNIIDLKRQLAQLRVTFTRKHPEVLRI